MQNAALKSFENFGDGKGIEMKNNDPTSGRLERIRQNMEKEDAIKYRANTNNRGYGFEQASVNKSAPSLSNKESMRNDSNPYEYNFRAQGNY